MAVCMGHRPKYEYRHGGLNPEAAQYWLELFMRTRGSGTYKPIIGCTDNELYGYGSLMDSKVSRWHLHASAYVNSISEDIARARRILCSGSLVHGTRLADMTTKCRFMGHHSILYVHTVVHRPMSTPQLNAIGNTEIRKQLIQ